LRKGFPTSDVTIYNNFNEPEDTLEIQRLSKDTECNYVTLSKRWHHAKWIQEMVKTNDESITILDSDMIFFDDLEPLEPEAMLNGYYIPIIWNEFAQCISYERLHTSFLLIQNCHQLRRMINADYPLRLHRTSDYNPLDPFMPDVGVCRGKKMFWDSTSKLFNLFGGNAFTPELRSLYAHVNSVGFYDVMHDRVENKDAFHLQHQKANEGDLEWFREWYKAEDTYYQMMNAKAQKMLSEGQQTEKSNIITLQ